MSIRLCANCSLAAQLDTNVDGIKMKHHSSYQGMMDAMSAGCEICAAVVSEIGEEFSRAIVDQEKSGFHDYKAEDMQISCKYVQRGDAVAYRNIVFEGKLLGIFQQFLPQPFAMGREIPFHSTRSC